MALGIVKYVYNRSSQLIGIIWFAVSCRGPLKKGSSLMLLVQSCMVEKIFKIPAISLQDFCQPRNI